MNLAQMRLLVRDALIAGLADNSSVGNIGSDFYYQDNIINAYLNEGQNVLYQIIRRAKSDYFARIMNTQDPALVIRQKTFLPISLQMQSGVGSYTLPPDFMRMKLITDQRQDAPKARFRFSDITSSDFRTVYGDTTSSRISPYLVDIIGMRTMIIRPIPVETFDVEYVYEKQLDPLNDYSVGAGTISRGQSTITMSGVDWNYFQVGDEIIMGASLAAPQTIDTTLLYPIIQSINTGANQITLSSPFVDLNDYSGSPYIRSRSSEIPELYHYLMVAYAVRQALSKGTNANPGSVDIWNTRWDAGIPNLIADVETRQISDTETSEAYLEGEEWN